MKNFKTMDEFWKFAEENFRDGKNISHINRSCECGDCECSCPEECVRNDGQLCVCADIKYSIWGN